LRDAALSNHFWVLFSICETKEIALGRLSLPLRLALCRIPFARKSNQKRTEAQRPPEPARVRLITAAVLTVVVLAMNLPPANSALLSTRLGALTDELFLLNLAVVPDGTAALNVTVR
jgi:hypothetical protein